MKKYQIVLLFAVVLLLVGTVLYDRVTQVAQDAPLVESSPYEPPIETQSPEPGDTVDDKVDKTDTTSETEKVNQVEKVEPVVKSDARLEPDAPFVEGGHYELLSEVQPVQTGDKIEVVEMFWYRCPHCYQLEPFITRWRQNIPDNAEFVPVPAVLNEQWAFNARMYYTLAALGLDQQLHAEVFRAIHETRLPLNTIEQFADWAVENGADRQTLIAAFNSFAVEAKVNFATVMSRKYGISGVPAIIVDGKYRTSVSLAGSHEKLLEVVDYLVSLAAKQRAG